MAGLPRWDVTDVMQQRGRQAVPLPTHLRMTPGSHSLWHPLVSHSAPELQVPQAVRLPHRQPRRSLSPRSSVTPSVRRQAKALPPIATTPSLPAVLQQQPSSSHPPPSPTRARPSPVFLAPHRRTQLNGPLSPEHFGNTSPGYYEGPIHSNPWSLAAAVKFPHKQSPAFLGRPRSRSHVRAHAGALDAAPLPQRARPVLGLHKAQSAVGVEGNAAHRSAHELSPATFEADVRTLPLEHPRRRICALSSHRSAHTCIQIAGTLEHRLQKSVVIPATDRALVQLRHVQVRAPRGCG